MYILWCIIGNKILAHAPMLCTSEFPTDKRILESMVCACKTLVGS